MNRRIRNKKTLAKRKKYILGTMFFLCMGCILFRQSAYALWKENEDGKIYYEDKNGVILTGFQEIEEKRYYFDPDGFLQIGKFYVEEENAYYFSDGEGIISGEGIVSVKDGFYSVNSDGKIQTGFINFEGATYYFNEQAEMVKGWFQSDGNWYYADDTGKLCTGFVTIDGYRYYFGVDGIRVSNTVMELEGVTYVFNEDGSVDENATVMYPVYAYIDEERQTRNLTTVLKDSKVQACAILRAGELKNGFVATSQGTMETLLKNRGVSCKNGFEFSYGGIEEYDVNSLLRDMERDSRLQVVLKNESVTAVGIGMSKQDTLYYYDVIFICQ